MFYAYDIILCITFDYWTGWWLLYYYILKLAQSRVCLCTSISSTTFVGIIRLWLVGCRSSQLLCNSNYSDTIGRYYPGSVVWDKPPARGQAGKQGAPAAGQSVTRRPTPRSPSISSISCSSSLAFHHQKYFRSVTQPATATSHSNARLVSLSEPLSRDLGRGEPQGSGLRTHAGARAAGRGVLAPPIAGRARLSVLVIGPTLARQWPRRPEFEARRSSLRSAERQA